VTGGAGFVGSNLAERLLDEGWSVRVVDSLTDYYNVEQKRHQIADLERRGAEVILEDLGTTDLRKLLDDTDVVFHQAGQPGVRLSWASGFGVYNERNVGVTQRLLEACRQASLSRFVFASSSSVYGNAASYPTREIDPTRPHSPYGVTKLAAELLCGAYASNYGLPVTSLRYFTVYGPRQRPDMAIRRMIDAALTGTPFPLYGDGSHVRDFTYVDDVVEANVLAAQADVPSGSVVNVAGGSSTTVAELLAVVGEAVGASVPVERLAEQPGDVHQTGGCTDLAQDLFGWSPAVGLRKGVEAQVAWQRSLACGAAS
jgi:nucleoside-diphosphate-sugar epimerase